MKRRLFCTKYEHSKCNIFDIVKNVLLKTYHVLFLVHLKVLLLISCKSSFGYFQTWFFKNSFPSKVAWKRIFSNLCIFKSIFFNTILISKFSIPYFSMCIPLIQLSNWISIQFNLDTMSFKKFIWMELNFHKITSFLLSIDQSMIARNAQQHRI
jgi:hypothetical protein